MFEDYKPPRRPATVDEITSVMLDFVRDQIPEELCNADLAVAEWAYAGDEDLFSLVFEHRVERLFGVNLRHSDWEKLLEGADERRLGDLAADLSAFITVPVVEDVSIGGLKCAKAGAFLTVRSMLESNGIDMRDVRPSTPLADVLTWRRQSKFQVLNCLAPNVFGAWRAESHPSTTLLWMATLIMPAIVVAGLLQLPQLAQSLGYLGLASVTKAVLAALIVPYTMDYNGLRTFRDLAAAIADNRPKV